MAAVLAFPNIFALDSRGGSPKRGVIFWLQVPAHTPDGAERNKQPAFSDQSPFAHEIAQASSSRRPKIIRNQSGNPALRFDGKDDFLAVKSLGEQLREADALTVLYVARTERDKAQYVWSLQAVDKQTDIARSGYGPGQRVRLKANSAVEKYSDSSPISASEYSVFAVVINASQATLFQNGVAVVSEKLDNSLPFEDAEHFSIGQEFDGGSASDYFHGELAELIVLNRATGDDDRLRWEQELAGRHAIRLGETGGSFQAAAADEPPNLEQRTNFHLIDSSPQGFALYRSAKPDYEAVKTWCQLGITEVMVLAGDAAEREEAFKRACPGIKVVYNVAQREEVPLDKAFLAMFDSWIADAKKNNKKVLFRCVAGAHRTGRLAAYYGLKHQGLSLKEAIQLMIRYGKDMYQHKLLTYQVESFYDHLNGAPCRHRGTKKEVNCLRE